MEGPEGQVHIAATDNFTLGEERIYLSRSVPEEQIWQEMLNGAVIVSEPFANRLGLDHEKSAITLNTAGGLRTFEVAGI